MGHHHNHSTTDEVSQRVNSPRFSGPMTRRAHSFKRSASNDASSGGGNNGNGGANNNGFGLSTHHEIDVAVAVINSPRSESAEGYQYLSQRVHGGIVRSKKSGGGIESVVGELGLKGRKKLGQWMFLLFCGVCLFLGVLKICAHGWFGSALDKASYDEDLSDLISQVRPT